MKSNHQNRIFVYCAQCKWQGYKTVTPDGIGPCPRCKGEVRKSRRHEERRFEKAKVDLSRFA